MVNDFEKKQKNTNKTQLLPSFLLVDRRKKAKQFWDPKRTLYSRHQCNELRWNTTIWAEELSYILSYQTESIDKNLTSY